jgi:hypothetical protein
MTDVNEYFTCTCKSKAKMLLAAAMVELRNQKNIKRFKNAHPQILFDNLELRVKIARRCLKEHRGPTPAERKSVG